MARTLDMLKAKGVWLVGTSDKAERSLYETDLTGPIGLILGNEGKGARRLTQEACDFMVSLPMAGNVSSLNVAVATGVCLYEAVRQRSFVNSLRQR
jgi:23S rRNA (guanosine2251-2'-O)-methyltransferase